MKLSSRQPWIHLLLVVALPTLMASKCRKDKGDEDTGDAVSIAQDYEVDMSVVSISPSTVEAEQASHGTVRGSGFARGARVFIGSTELANVEYVDSTQLRVDIPALAAGSYDVEVMNPDSTSSTLRQGLRAQASAVSCEPITVYFALDKSELTSTARGSLERQLACYRDSSGPIRVEGHCDERGTTDYNLALGERRARSVKQWLGSQGVEAGRVSTISYGEERPAVEGSGESAWSKNRRAEISLGR